MIKQSDAKNAIEMNPKSIINTKKVSAKIVICAWIGLADIIHESEKFTANSKKDYLHIVRFRRRISFMSMEDGREKEKEKKKKDRDSGGDTIIERRNYDGILFLDW